MPHRHITTITIALTLGPLAALGLSSCTATPTPESSPTSNTTTTAGPQLLGESPGVTGSTDVPAKVPNDTTKRAAVTLDTCTATVDGWQAQGTITNTTTATTQYLITVFFTGTNGTVVGWSQTANEATGENPTEWTAAATFTAPAETSCTLVGVG